MALFKNIIVPLDGSKLSDQALPAAKLMANATHTPLTLLRAYGPLPRWHADAEHGRFSAAAAAGEHDRTMAELTRVKRRMAHWGVEPPISVEVREGPAHEAIINLANRDPRALIVMSTHGRGGLTRMLTGSVAARVVRNASNPTLIVRCSRDDCPIVPLRIDNILVPLDGSSFAENALDYAGELAAAFGARIHLFRSTPNSEQLRVNSDWSHAHVGATYLYADPVEMAKHLATASQEYLGLHADELRARFPVSDVTVAHSMELPSSAIPRLAGQLENGLVVMATHGRRGMGRALFGSVADRVVHHSTFPTFLVRGPLRPEVPTGEMREPRQFAEATAS